MPVLRTFIVRTPEIAAAMWAFVKQNAGPAVERNRPLQVVISEHRPTRSNQANSFMWAAVLTPLSEQACVNGKWFAAETWSQYLKQQFLPEVNAAGMEKWQYLPDGSRELAMGTSDLKSEEFAEYLNQVQAYAATEFGVVSDRAPEHN